MSWNFGLDFVDASRSKKAQQAQAVVPPQLAFVRNAPQDLPSVINRPQTNKLAE